MNGGRSHQLHHRVTDKPESQHLFNALHNVKEEFEELRLGEVTLNLSEFVEIAFAQKSRNRSSSSGSEKWVKRRYLLNNGKTNALLRVAVKMDWIGGERSFKA